MIRTPTEATVRKYGLSLLEWRRMLLQQGNVCAVCRKEPPSGLLTIDHEHVKGWKKMPAELRRVFVRGLVCWQDNRFFLARGMTPERADAIAQYLRAYEARRDAALAHAA
jgi:hypothetical protein